MEGFGAPRSASAATLTDSRRCGHPPATDKPGAGLNPEGVKAMMHQKHYFSSALVLLLICVMAVRAQASTVVYDEVGHYYEIGLVSGPEVGPRKIKIDSPGTYKASLLDFEYPKPFEILSLSVIQHDKDTNNDMLLGGRFGTGSLIFNVASVGASDTFKVNLGAIPQDGEKGLYGLQVLPIPIPPAFWLFLSAMIGILGVARRGRGPGVA
jgi:hypothetical protein